MTRPKALLFDCFGLFAPDPMVNFFTRKLGHATLEVKDRYCSPGDLGEVTLGEILDAMERDLGVNKAEVLAYFDELLVPDKAMISYVLSLKEKYRVCLVSNCMDGIMEQVFGNTDFFSCFDRLYLSYRIKRIKPNADYFEYVLNDLGSKPEEVLFVDDNPDNVAAAAKLGIPHHLFVSLDDLKEEFARLGL